MFEVIAMKQPKKIVSLRLPVPMYERVSNLARETGRTVPNYIRWILRGYLEHAQVAPTASG